MKEMNHLKKWPTGYTMTRINIRGGFIALYLLSFLSGVFAQEALLSPNEFYYDFLSLGGLIERPYLNYRTLSDSVWDTGLSDNSIWKNINIGVKKNINDAVVYKIYGPEIFTSYNTASPYGQNDSALWQGKGFNTYISAGGRLELYGFELTLLPNFAFSGNQSFDMVPSKYNSGEAANFGYYGITSVDAPQRFGDEPYYEFSWGDSEIRYSWKTLTIGFGTQHIWLGPARINPVLLSNNAVPYPKLDIGLRKQTIMLFDSIYLGEIELRAFWGMLSESDFFDDNSDNDRNLLTGFTAAYSFPAFLKGFTIGFNRLMLSKWENMDYSSIFTLLWPVMKQDAGSDNRDQRASLVFSYLFPETGFELYFEWGRNDFSPETQFVIRYPFHTQAYTFGARKNLFFTDKFQGLIVLEITNLESSRDYEFIGGTTFYAHHRITQGHTSRGQWLGAGLGTGGNSQYLGFTLFYDKGYGNLFFQRQNIDNDYVWFKHAGASISVKNQDHDIFKTLVSIGLNNYITLADHFGIFAEMVYSYIYNPTYDPENKPDDHNLYVSLGLKFIY
jgi:hypothetical protein